MPIVTTGSRIAATRVNQRRRHLFRKSVEADFSWRQEISGGLDGHGGHFRDREQFWWDHVAGWKSSGLSLRLYSERHELKAGTLGYWNSRLARMLCCLRS
jgi:hypothetical protein